MGDCNSGLECIIIKKQINESVQLKASEDDRAV